MTDLALKIAGTKLAISVVLGAAVWLAARGNRRPRLCHALCLTLLAGLLIPPLTAVPLLRPEPTADISAAAESPDAASPASMAVGDAGPAVLGGAVDGGWLDGHGGFGLVLLWLVGAVAVLGWTLARTRGFRRFLRGASREAPPELQRMAREVARTLGLANVPAIHTTDALVSPMACWSGGAVRVLIPSALLTGLERSELRWIVAHELAHIRRRDHLVRWLEWLACTAFWWNPIAWWARRRLRAAGEVCCDALVVRAFDGAPRAYAGALVRAIDLVREGTHRPPVFASAADSGRRTRLLERRLRMIITNRPTSALPPALRLVLRGGLVASLALGLVYCSEQTSPTAAEAPKADLPKVDPETVERPTIEWLSPASKVELTDGIRIEADMIRVTYAGDAGHGYQGLVVVDYDDEVEVPLLRNERLWAAVAELREDAPDTRVLIVRPTEDGGWSFLDRIPELASGSYHVMTFGPNPAAGWEFTLPAGPRPSGGTER